MTDWKLHEEAWQDIRHGKVDEYVSAQRQSFLEGFEAAVEEAESFKHLREWLEEQRDRAQEQDNTAQYAAYVSVLVKLIEIGCEPDHD